ncbi:MAG: substrate binding domain-containing protein, partial [Pseudomonadota bacterium]
RLEMMLSDRYVDPIEEGFDVTLRVGAPSHSTSLAGRALAEIPVVLCAAPAYLAAADAPRDPGDLRLHRCLHYGYLASGSQWRFREPNGADRTVRINCVMWSNNGEVLRDAALAGTGIALLPTFIVGDALAAGALVPLLREYERPPLELTALSPRHRQQAAKIALFTEFVAAELSLPSWLGSADQAGGAPA